jgi:hypothetical protein
MNDRETFGVNHHQSILKCFHELSQKEKQSQQTILTDLNKDIFD